MEAVSTLNARRTTQSIDEALSDSVKASKAKKNRMLTTVIGALKFLTRQNIPLRGSYESGSTAANYNMEPNSNLNQVS